MEADQEPRTDQRPHSVPLFGNLEQFTPGPTASFTRYVDRVKIYFRANDVLDANRQRGVFLSVVGPTCFNRLVDLLAPRSPGEVPLDEIVNVLKTHYDPKPSKRVRTLNAAERRYAQVDREALAVAFGTKKFNLYLYGRHFTIVTDHKPLLGLLDATKATPAVCSPRILRWSVDLGGYDYELVYQPGHSIPHADTLSRLPLPIQPESVPGVSDILLLQSDCSLPLSPNAIAHLSRKGGYEESSFQFPNVNNEE